MSTGLADRFYFSYNVQASNPKRSLILSPARKLVNVSCLEIFMTLPKFEKCGLILNG